MLLPTSAGPATNGTTPLNPLIGARQARSLQRTAIAAARAKAAVLGYCTAPGSVAGMGVNLMVDMQRAPNVPAMLNATQGASSGATNTGAGGFAAEGPVGAPIVIPLGQVGLPQAPPIPPLTTSQGPNSPVFSGGSPAAIRTSRMDCMRQPGQPLPNFLAGQSPTWGGAAARPAAASSSAPASPLFAWMLANPLLAGILAVGGLVTLAYAVQGGK